MNWQTLSSLAAAIGALAAAGALIATLQQLRAQTRQSIDERISEIAAVSLTLDVVEKPAAAPDSRALVLFRYDFVLHNPGRYAICNVCVNLAFPDELARLHFDGRRDDPTSSMSLTTPSVSPLGQHRWKRSLLLESRYIDDMKKTSATITFSTPDAGACTTIWPMSDAVIDDDLRARLPDHIRASTHHHK